MCNNEYNGSALKGKWNYFNNQNDYSEIWFNDSLALTLDATSYNIEYYKYETTKDSLFLYNMHQKNGKSNPIFSFRLTKKENNHFIVENRFTKINLIRFDDIERIDTTASFRDSLYSAFGSRAMKLKGE